MILKGDERVYIPKFDENSPRLYFDYKTYITPAFDRKSREKYIDFLSYYNSEDDAKALCMLVEPPYVPNSTRCKNKQKKILS